MPMFPSRSLVAAACLVGLASAPAFAVEPATTAKPASKPLDAQATVTRPGVTPAAPVAGAAKVGKPAPDFTLTGVDGKPVRLASLKGKVVVLEWFNPGCPFVQHAHGEGALKDMAARWAKRGVVWVAINSSAPGKQGHGAPTNLEAQRKWAMGHALLLDETGHVGRAYGAKTTPHVYLIDRKGVLVYAGGLDNAPFGRAKEGAVTPYLEQALEAVLAGKKVLVPETPSYGCSVKYSG